MVRNETTIRVVLDTTQAKGELQGLTRRSAATIGRISSSLRQSVGRGLGVVGLGSGVGAGLAAVRGATESGFGDAIGEAFGGIGAQISQALLGNLPAEARAARSAREETIQAFGALVGETGEIPAGARNYFDQIRSLRQVEESGRLKIEQDDQLRGPGATELIDRILKGIGEALAKAVDALADRLNPFS